MPNINVMTWNSRGESAAKAAFLQSLILNNPVVPGWQPDLIVIQEAQAAPGGAIWTMLAALGGQPGGGNYTVNAPQLVNVAGNGEGYILKASNNVTILGGAFQLVDLAADAGVAAAINTFPLWVQATLTAEVNAMRDPAWAQITFGGRTVQFMTWHAPLGPGQVLLGIHAAVNYDAYYFLQTSNFYNNILYVPGANNLSIIAGDLNVTAADLTNPTGLPAPINSLLPSWVGVSNHLDHILARRDVGGLGPIAFPNAGHYPTGGLSDHDVLVSTVHWP